MSVIEETPQNDPGDLDSLVNTLTEATTAPEPEVEASAEEPSSEPVERPDYIEEKFWTGDLSESLEKQAKGYRDLHSAYGRMANDLGTQRKMTDQLLALDKRAADLGEPAPQREEATRVDPDRLFDDPRNLVDYLEQRDAKLRQEILNPLIEQKKQDVEAAFMEKHPDFANTVQNPQFIEWVKASPIRSRAAALAGQGDYSVADELFTEWEANLHPPLADQTSTEQNAVPDQDLEGAKKASTVSGGGESPAGGKGKVYRRADLIRLKLERPDVYQDPTFQAEIMAAYQEGRVK